MAKNELEKFNIEDTLNSNINLDVTKDDMVSIAVTEYEDKLNTTQRLIKVSMQEISTAINKQEKEISELIESTGTVALTKTIAKEVTALSKMFPNKDNRLIADIVQSSSISQVTTSKGVKKLQCGASASFGTNDSSVSYEKSILIAFPVKITKTMKPKVIQLQDEYTEKQSHLYEVRKTLSDIPSLERHARANIAKQTIIAKSNGDKVSYMDFFKVPGFDSIKLLK